MGTWRGHNREGLGTQEKGMGTWPKEDGDITWGDEGTKGHGGGMGLRTGEATLGTCRGHSHHLHSTDEV